jgi:hypothetical protein
MLDLLLCHQEPMPLREFPKSGVSAAMERRSDTLIDSSVAFA